MASPPPTSQAPITLKAARDLLGVGPFYSAAELRRAFREAAKRAHPDRDGGDEARFHEVTEAYHRLQATLPGPRGAAPDPFFQPPAPRSPEPTELTLDPIVAMNGGEALHRTGDGRRLRLTLPAGLRSGDTVRVDGRELTVRLVGTPEMLVRGDDVWITATVPPRLLDEGGRIAVDTPVGRRIVWLTKKAGERKLVRLAGQGLPARGRHAQGHLFLRLAAAPAGAADSAARTLLRRFAAAWAA
ncbi:MAG: DnaJ domain-containing protein [Proteobacteria bacterium]|nr:DnaJ domain-containing protein [Pseudomonadota bacterium]